MPVNDELGIRMKTYYESIPKTKLMRRTPVVIRIDGKAFHTFQEKASVEAETKKIQAEADANAMIITAQAEADAYRIKSAEITDNLLKKWELDARKEHGWVTIQGASAVVTGQ